MNPPLDPNDMQGATEPCEPSAEALQRRERAEKLIQKYVLWSFGAGAIPIPVFDVLASVSVQVKLIQELSGLYGVDYREDIAKSVLASLATTIGGLMIGSHLGASMAKWIPGIGTKIGIVKTAGFFGLSTHITGKVLVMHFEAGGTLLDLDPIAMRKYFEAEFEASAQNVP